MASDAAARAIRERIKEIDEALGQYRDLTKERAALQSALDFYDHRRGTVSLFRGLAALDEPVRVTRFQPRHDSKTTRIVNAIADILESTPGNAAPFPSLRNMLP